MNLIAEKPNAGRHERVAWFLVAGGYALVLMAILVSLMVERFSAPGPGAGAAIVFTFVFAAFGLLVFSAVGSSIAVWALRSGDLRWHPAVFALLALGAVGVAVPGIFLAAIVIRG